MSSIKGSRVPVDSQKGLILDVRPYTTHTIVSVAIDWRDQSGRHHSPLASWHLRLTRADLAGHSTDDVLRAVFTRILRRMESGRQDPADRQAEGSGAPLGAGGGTVTEDTLPGL